MWRWAEGGLSVAYRGPDYPLLTVGGAIHNIVVSTIGNLIGGSLMVGVVYWFVYLRRR